MTAMPGNFKEIVEKEVRPYFIITFEPVNEKTNNLCF